MAISEESGGMYMPVAPAYTGGNCGGFGNGDGWWIILLFILLGGWGNRGYGSGANDNYVLTSDMAMLERRTDSITNGLCDGFYSQAQISNNLGMSLAQQGFETRNAINGIGTQLSNCCCDVKGLVKDVNYNMAMNHNATQQTICGSSRDIIDNQTAGTRAILDELRSQAIEAKNTRIADLERQLTMANLAASQNAQTATIIADNCAQTAKLQPTPVPAYVVQNPNCCYNSCGCGC